MADGDEVVRLCDATVRSEAVPPNLSITVDDGGGLGGQRNGISRDFNQVDVAVEILEGGGTGESDCGAIFEFGKVESLTAGDNEVGEGD